MNKRFFILGLLFSIGLHTIFLWPAAMKQASQAESKNLVSVRQLDAEKVAKPEPAPEPKSAPKPEPEPKPEPAPEPKPEPAPEPKPHLINDNESIISQNHSKFLIFLILNSFKILSCSMILNLSLSFVTTLRL